MSTSTPTEASVRPASRTTVAVVGAVAVLVAVTLVILVVGWVPLPELPSLAEEPDASIPGTIVHAAESRDETCLVVSEASGASSSELPCLAAWIDSVSWTTDGTVAVTSYGEFGPRMDILDPATGAIVETITLGTEDRPVPEPLPGGEATRSDGTRVVAGAGGPREPDGTATLTTIATDGTRTTIVELEGPRDYAFRSASWSPDGNWVLAGDSRGRLIIVADDGDPGPRLLVDTGDGDRWMVPAAWYIPGNPTGTIDLDEVRTTAQANG